MMPVVRYLPWQRFGTSNKAVAALEFALTAPILILLLAGAGDYGLAVWSKSCLANAVAQGAYYAFRTGTTVSATNVVTLVTNASSLTGVTATATDPTLCYCPSGTPATLGTAVSCTSTCTDTSTPGNYITITGKYTPTAFFSSGGLLISKFPVLETVTVRLK